MGTRGAAEVVIPDKDSTMSGEDEMTRPGDSDRGCAGTARMLPPAPDGMKWVIPHGAERITLDEYFASDGVAFDAPTGVAVLVPIDDTTTGTDMFPRR